MAPGRRRPVEEMGLRWRRRADAAPRMHLCCCHAAAPSRGSSRCSPPLALQGGQPARDAQRGGARRGDGRPVLRGAGGLSVVLLRRRPPNDAPPAFPTARCITAVILPRLLFVEAVLMLLPMTSSSINPQPSSHSHALCHGYPGSMPHVQRRTHARWRVRCRAAATSSAARKLHFQGAPVVPTVHSKLLGIGSGLLGAHQRTNCGANPPCSLGSHRPLASDTSTAAEADSSATASRTNRALLGACQPRAWRPSAGPASAEQVRGSGRVRRADRKASHALGFEWRRPHCDRRRRWSGGGACEHTA